jgi:4-hydroxythreonine-4-phosphate dehydrogenase
MEVIITMLEDTRLTELCTPVVFASSKLASYHRNAIDKRDFQFRLCDTIEDIKEGANNLVLSWDDNVEITLGLPTNVSGTYALKSIDAAIEAAKNGKIHALLTAPINKHNIAESVEGFSGHTGYLAKEFGNEVLMILASGKLKVATVTGHVPISKVAEGITEASINQAIALLAQSLERDFGIVKPRIAVLGLNPHAGEMGSIGSEEKDVIRPAIENAQTKNTIVKGPFPADGFFGQGYESKFDAVLGMYHDQVLVPFKSLAMGSGTNFTAGLEVVRASPDHGTAMHLAGKGKADATSMRNALYTAIDVYHARKGYDEMTKDPLKKQKEKS